MVEGPRRVTVQRITTTWTKRTRGAPGREHRARLPVAYPLPNSALVSRSTCVGHDVARSEASAYAERFAEWFEAQPVARTHGGAGSAIQLTHREAGLDVAFNGALTDTGRPARSPLPVKILRPGEVATVRFNGRFGHEDIWYEDKIIHIAVDWPSRDLFRSASTAFVIDARVDLW